MNAEVGHLLKMDKKSAIQSLTDGFGAVLENDSHLGITYLLKSTEKPIFFTEGITDRIILETAWKKSNNGTSMPFIIQEFFSANSLGQLFGVGDQAPDGIFHQYPDRKMVALFNFDHTGYNNWNRKNKFNTIVEEDPSSCLVRCNDANGYLMLLPVLNNEYIKPLAMSDDGNSLEQKSQLMIESLFLGNKKLRELYFNKYSTPGGGSYFAFTGKKRLFAYSLENESSASFEEFRPLFAKILDIIS